LIFRRKKVIFWGHSRTYTKLKSKLEEKFKLFIAHRAAFYLVYTKEGRDFLVRKGMPSGKIQIVNNSTDIGRFKINRGIDRSFELDKSQLVIGLSKPPTCIFLGSLIEDKKLEFLFNSVNKIKESLPDFQFTFIGDGSEGKKVSEVALSSDYIQFLGFKNQEEIDKISNQFSLILNPGRMGLIAVDSLMLKLPIVTLRDSYHAPEYEYIKGNFASVSVSGSVKDYANAVINLLNSKEDLQKMRYVCAEVREHYTFEIMVRNFKNGILQVLNQETENV
jgi:glycosyltransferase involved in cell wall biosynthesis